LNANAAFFYLISLAFIYLRSETDKSFSDAVKKGETWVEVGRARAEARLFHSLSKAWAQEGLKLNLFSNVFEPTKTRAQIVKADHFPSKNQARPT
jgi:hypothetical protein